MAKSYGPAGIFSTDDYVADQRQIDAENFTDDFDEDPCDECGYIACVCGELDDEVEEPCDQCGHYVCTCKELVVNTDEFWETPVEEK